MNFEAVVAGQSQLVPVGHLLGCVGRLCLDTGPVHHWHHPGMGLSKAVVPLDGQLSLVLHYQSSQQDKIREVLTL